MPPHDQTTPTGRTAPGGWVMRLVLAAFGLPFLSIGFMVCAFGLIAIFSGNSIIGGIIGFVFGLPFFLVGALFCVGALQGPGTIAKKLKNGPARDRLEALQKRMQPAAEEAGVDIAPSQTVISDALNGSRYARCPECDSSITDASLISPSGDVRCDFCRTWFNAKKS